MRSSRLSLLFRVLECPNLTTLHVSVDKNQQYAANVKELLDAIDSSTSMGKNLKSLRCDGSQCRQEDLPTAVSRCASYPYLARLHLQASHSYSHKAKPLSSQPSRPSGKLRTLHLGRLGNQRLSPITVQALVGVLPHSLEYFSSDLYCYSTLSIESLPRLQHLIMVSYDVVHFPEG